MVEHLGEKLILSVGIFGYTISFDVITVIVSWVVMVILIVGALLLRRGLRGVEDPPSKRQTFLEMCIGGMQSLLEGAFESKELIARLFPMLASLFGFVLLSNWISIIPRFQSPTADLNVTLSLGLMVFFLSHYYGIRTRGTGRYLRRFVEPLNLFPLSLILNVAGELAKPMSHSFRLFGNVFGGAILAAVITSFIPIAFPVVIQAFYGLFIGAVQAFVFTLLAIAYISITVSE